VRAVRVSKTWAVGVIAGICLVLASPTVAFQGPWVAPVDLTATGQDATIPALAVAPDGTATAAWERTGAYDAVQVSTRPPGGTFGAAVDVSTTGQNARGPQVAVAPDGTTTVVWRRYTGANTNIQASTRPPGGVFGAPVDLSAPGHQDSQPQVAVGSDGTTSVVWTRATSMTTAIVQASVRPPVGGFGAAVDLSTVALATGPQVAVAADGTTTAVWTAVKAGNAIVQASTRPPSSVFGGPVDLSLAGQNSTEPRVATGPDGLATAIWLHVSGTDYIVQHSTRPPGGAFGQPLDLSETKGVASEPDLTIAPNGTTTTIWRRSDGVNDILQAATRLPGGSFGNPVNLDFSDGTVDQPQVAAALDGTTTAIWYRSTATGRVIRLRTRPPGGTFGPHVELGPASDSEPTPQVALGPDGAAAAVWNTRPDGYELVSAAFTANSPGVRSTPTVTGNPALGATLACDGGSWTGAASIQTTWLRGGAEIATGPAYQVAAADQGAALACRSRATNPFGAIDSLSGALSIPAATTASAPATELDRRAPQITLVTRARLSLRQFLSGVSAKVAADEPATVVAELLGRARGARISAAPFNLVLGSRTARGVRRATTMKIKPSRALVGKARRLRVRLRLTATDAAGNRRVATKTIRVG
jgi:hypothetical protein